MESGAAKNRNDLNNDELMGIIETFCSILRNNQDKPKFHALSDLSVLLRLCLQRGLNKNLAEQTRKSITWAENAKIGLFEILSNKISDSDRDNALIVSSLFLELFGFD